MEWLESGVCEVRLERTVAHDAAQVEAVVAADVADVVVPELR